jgi:hypothetical protein
MWSAHITQLWVNAAEYDSQGYILKDYRHEIEARDVLKDEKQVA